MNKFLSGLAVVALLFTPLAITSRPGGHLEGEPRVRAGPGDHSAGVDRVEIVFHGGRNMVVSCSRATRRPCGSSWTGGSVAPWRLEAASPVMLSIVLTGCEAKRKPSPQLTKIRLRPMAVDGDAVVLDNGSPAYTDWGNVVVPRHGRVQVRPTSSPTDAPWCSLYLEGAPWLDIANWHAEYERSPRAIYLEAGSPVANELGEMSPTAEPLVPQAGQRVILLPCEKHLRARATRSARCPPRSTARPWALAAERRYQEVGVRFTSAGDQWVTATVGGPLAGRSLTQLALTGPDGSTLVGLNTATVGSVDLWYAAGARDLPADGADGPGARDREHHRVERPRARRRDAGRRPAAGLHRPGAGGVGAGHGPAGRAAVRAVRRGRRVPPTGGRTRTSCPSSCAVAPSARTTAVPPSHPSGRRHYFPLSFEGRYVFLVAFGAGQTGTVSLRLTPPA